MRIAVANWSDRLVGGAEGYLAIVIPQLAAAGHDVALWSQVGVPADRAPIATELPRWSAHEIGLAGSLAALKAWEPDIVYSHGFTDAVVEEELLGIAPAVFYAHNYYGTCITGSKTTHRPTTVPCGRRFGAACIGHFYPRRCGGLSPITMLKQYRLQSRRLDLLGRYRAVLCASTHMRDEFLRHGIAPDRLHLVPYPVPAPVVAADAIGPTAPASGEPWRILFAGRLEADKGADILLDALPIVRDAVAEPLEVLFAGDGRERGALEERAAVLVGADPDLRIGFTGWLDRDAVSAIMANVHLLAFPSLWPEPFGLTGVEAGHLGVPAAAFAAGGVPDWLLDGTSGALAPADPPTAAGLAHAILRCLDRTAYPRLSRGARASARRFTLDAHMAGLGRVLEAAGPAVQPARTP